MAPWCCAVWGTLRRQKRRKRRRRSSKSADSRQFTPGPDVDGTVVVPRHCLWVAKVLDELDSWSLRWALWAWWGWERESSVRFHFLHCLSTPNHRPLNHSRQRQRRGILAACPRSPYALLGTTIECYDSESSPFYPVRVENDDEAMKLGAREPGQCPGGEDPASQETLVQPPRVLASF